MTSYIPKMSLVSQFDDLVRYNNVLCNGAEEEFRIFVENELELKKQVKKFQQQVQELEERISALEGEKKRFQCQMAHLRMRCEDEQNRKRKAEADKMSLERQIDLIKEVLLADKNMDDQTREKLVQLSFTCKVNSSCLRTIEESVGSLLSSSELDESDDDIFNRPKRKSKRRSKGKRKSSENKISSKKTKLQEVQEEINRELPEVNIIPVRERSFSEPISNCPGSFPVKKIFNSDSDQVKINVIDQNMFNRAGFSGSAPGDLCNIKGNINPFHTFATKTVLRQEKCTPCGQIIKFCKPALKCQDCRVVSHPECKEECPIPCIPMSTPLKENAGYLIEYTSSTSPMIPPLIMHCVTEVEKRGLKDIGLYRIPGSDREVKSLKEKFLRGRTMPNISQADVHTLCGTIKDFLRSLKEPIIPQSFWQAFVNAAEIPDYAASISALHKCVTDLPQPNRETLFFLILHWKRIAKSPQCKMPAENLAKVLGPTIVGYSTSNPAEMNMICETKLQYKVMQRLLLIPTDSWKILKNRPPVLHTPNAKAQKSATLDRGAIPLSAKKRTGTIVRTPLRTPIRVKNPAINKLKKKTPAFLSPSIK